MVAIRVDSRQFSRRMKNIIDYSNGFFEGVQMERMTFMRFLAGYTKEALYKYIDSKARMNPEALHHVYEPGQTGSESGRLFHLTATPRLTQINFTGEFLPSSVPPLNGGHVFVNRATVMENGITVVIAPKNSDVLVFEDDGDLVFTRKTIIIEHPGGDAVAGSFGKVVDEFFNEYFTNGLLEPVLSDLRTADEFMMGFYSGGRAQGMRAGREYLTIRGVGFE